MGRGEAGFYCYNLREIIFHISYIILYVTITMALFVFVYTLTVHFVLYSDSNVPVFKHAKYR